MRRVLTTIVAAVALFSFVAAAHAIPANGDMDSAIKTLENPEQPNPVKKQVPKKKVHKQQKTKSGRKKAAAAPAEPPATSPPAAK